MANASDILTIARRELGNNTGFKYWKYVFPQWSYVNGNVTPYCACFVSWVFHEAGQTFPGLPGGYCPSIYNSARNAGLTIDKTAARPGDVVLFDWGGDGVCDHIGIVESNCGSYLQTIEGNTNGGKVARRTRSFGVIKGVFRPRWTAIAATPAPTTNKPALLTVDGWGGPATVRVFQARMGTTQDGVISGQYRSCKKNLGRIWSVTWEGNGQSEAIRELQHRLGLGVDGSFGPNTCRAYQRHLGVDDDGEFGPNSTRAWQLRLNSGEW